MHLSWEQSWSQLLLLGIIGFVLDNWFGTKPILIIIFFFFGTAAGITNVIKAAKNAKGYKIMATNPMEQFEVHKIGPEIEDIRNKFILHEILVFSWL